VLCCWEGFFSTEGRGMLRRHTCHLGESLQGQRVSSAGLWLWLHHAPLHHAQCLTVLQNTLANASHASRTLMKC
jgi:hypothetical protein